MWRRLFGRKPPKIVALGGGTGLSTMLRGLKEHTDRLTAIVTVGDDGGSSGRLRSDFDIIPPGDIRNCLVALADAGPTMEALFQYRFGQESGTLQGHSFGNLLLTALSQITGDFRQAVREATRILNVSGRVLPATDRKFALVVTHPDGSRTTGEAQITRGQRKPISRLDLKPTPAPVDAEIREALAEADLIVLGPGSLYTSVIPNCLVPGMVDAMRDSPAPIVYVCNVMTQPGETDGYTVADHLRAIEAHTESGLVDAVVVNTRPIDERLLLSYRASGQEPVVWDAAAAAAWSFSAMVVPADLASQTELVRHDPARLARLLIERIRDFKRANGHSANGANGAARSATTVPTVQR
ncbi:MAG: uridine diphosphate-N-acetylglucosamine-binding protein YvcK [Planctomycetota bacterium]